MKVCVCVCSKCAISSVPQCCDEYSMFYICKILIDSSHDKDPDELLDPWSIFEFQAFVIFKFYYANHFHLFCRCVN